MNVPYFRSPRAVVPMRTPLHKRFCCTFVTHDCVIDGNWWSEVIFWRARRITLFLSPIDKVGRHHKLKPRIIRRKSVMKQLYEALRVRPFPPDWYVVHQVHIYGSHATSITSPWGGVTVRPTSYETICLACLLPDGDVITDYFHMPVIGLFFRAIFGKLMP